MSHIFSVIIPVYNRPNEADELLQSLARQTMNNFRTFEVVVVEDGSQKTCRNVVERYAQTLDIHYFFKENSGPGPTRNFGAKHSTGDYLIFLDSDVILPDGYLKAVQTELEENPCDAFGGPDREHESFTDVQKAISYSMTSFFTTGGIRGGKKQLDKFYPRSFNMGIRRKVFFALGGFEQMRFGEDIDLSTRIFENGHTCRLFPKAWVYHKRRTDFRKFFRQVYNSGVARINLYKRHPKSLKIVHTLPAAFTVGTATLLLLSNICQYALLPIVLYALLIFGDACRKYKNVKTGFLCIAAAFVQLIGYGCGFLTAVWKRLVLRQGEFDSFKKTFYK